MASKVLERVLRLTWCAVLVGCSEREAHEISATAVARSSFDGTEHVRSATAAEQASLDADIQKRKAIDQRYPRSPVPWGAPSERVVGVSAPGVLEIESGRKFQLDGIRCDERAVEYLRRMVQDDTVSVVISTTGGEGGEPPMAAEVWTADSDLQRKGLATSASYSNLNETAITSDWCRVVPSATSRRNECYATLAQAFQHVHDR